MQSLKHSLSDELVRAPENVTKFRHTHLFIGGLHASGTTLVHRLLCMHPAVSGFANTGAPENEGQHLQNLYPTARAHGGPGRFAFDESAHLTENDRSLVATCSAGGLWSSWAAHWDLSKRVLIEKSPPNLIRARFLQAVFPEAKFIFVIRHPLPVSGATQKWTNQPISELVQHWVQAHQIFRNDLPHVKSWAWLRYEDLTADPERVLRDIFRFCGLPPISPRKLILDNHSTPTERVLEYLAQPLRKLIKLAGFSSRPPRELIVDRNSRYFSGFGEPIDRERITGIELIGKFGYKLIPPYYETPSGKGRVISNSFKDLPEFSLGSKGDHS
jgi:Sulfotransferase family